MLALEVAKVWIYSAAYKGRSALGTAEYQKCRSQIGQRLRGDQRPCLNDKWMVSSQMFAQHCDELMSEGIAYTRRAECE